MVEAETALPPPALGVRAGAKSRWAVCFVALSLFVIVADQAAKLAIRAALQQGGNIPVIPGWVHWSHVLNHGAAWGMLSGQRPFLIGVALVVMVVVAGIAREIGPRGPLAWGGLGLVLGGAIGNLIDRVLFGAVTDFIDLDTPIRWLHDFPVFNIADSALTVGVVLLALEYLLSATREPVTPPLQGEAASGQRSQ